ncbi:MAG: ATPase, partial [Terriglobales bacterium]
ETALTDGILQAWKFNTIDELVQRANATPPPDFPPLFRAVLHAAEEGDAIAGELLVDAGTRLAALAVIVVRRLAHDAEEGSPAADALPIATLPIAMTGSVFRQSHQVRQIFYDVLQKSFPGIDVRPDLVDPVEGALARAKRL